MNITDFLNFVNLNMGIQVTEKDLDIALVDIDQWDSINAIRLMSLLEKKLSSQISIADYLQAYTLRHIYELCQKVHIQ
ncbi:MULTISPECIES: phosphopantetheine-binding protein [unclassified Acinetobacter]|uniref:phosphopantetheine-binding protein n=1 Tax=unclassified Acinetobacter TaxID=196816 RepID=UPI0018EC1B3D|nr:MULTISPECIES: phosphopantetheine-binding protein [unclassified Acinetobacter]MBJ6352989.1 hypothetical protein [Acinetobacter sp. c1]MBM0958608.1 hypothetical protein [Acinetobacter sp. C13]